MDGQTELEIVTTAYFLEDRLAKLRTERINLNNSKPRQPLPPAKPQELHYTITPKPYPPINPTVDVPSFWKSGVYIAGAGLGLFFISSILLDSSFFMIPLLIGVFCFPAALAVTVYKFFQIQNIKKQQIQERTEWIRNTPEYQNECRRIDEENRINQEQMNKDLHEKYLKELEAYQTSYRQYEINIEEYNSILIPIWSQEISKLDEAISSTQTALDEVYSNNIIPNQYRNINALSYIATFMNTSEYDLKFAIERYDMQVLQLSQLRQISYQQAQLEISRESIGNQQYANWLQEEALDIAENSNDILRSVDSWQKADILTREYRRMKTRVKARH